ncbi:MAG: hypothetical protein ABI824_04585 [Acidobacteriota bacterium]
MPCPYFSPERILESETWLVPPRFPLGSAYQGTCLVVASVPFVPALDHQERVCNFGYPTTSTAGCERFPSDAPADAVRFAWASQVGSRRKSDLVQIVYILEKEHTPAEHGVLDYSLKAASFRPNTCTDPVLAQALKFAEQGGRRLRGVALQGRNF